MGLPWHKRSAGRRGVLRTDRTTATNRSVTAARALDGLPANELVDDAATEMFVSATASTIATSGISRAWAMMGRPKVG